MVALPTWIEEFGLGAIESRAVYEHVGCGTRDIAGLKRWFSSSEIERLRGLGFGIVEIVATRIIAASANQVLFARVLPLWFGARERSS
jgi:hypothetical protein